MDDAERRVVRRWKSILAENVIVTSELVQSFKDCGLLTDDKMRQVIQVADNQSTKTSRLVDVVLSSPLDSAFATLCFVLSRHYGWIARDMDTDVRVEKGDIIIDGDVLREAGMLVHRKFGSSKRFCETDKKDMQELLALKLQVSRDEWQRENEKLQEALNASRATTSTREVRAQKLVRALSGFVKENSEYLATHAHGMITTSDTLRKSLEDANKDGLGRLEGALDELLKRFTTVLTHRQMLHREREKCIKSMDVKDERMPLDSAIRVFLQTKRPLEDDLQSLARDLAEKDAAFKRMTSKIFDLESELNEKDEIIERLTAQLGASTS
ncbi:hypothetical protein LSAT2_007551 [Lamellibrachia satsuma]|nr:hypothetical protein LSAT2_007551 [Lamellibrachia satsuma]